MDLGVDLVMFEGFGEKLRIFQIRGTIRTEENPSAIPDSQPDRSIGVRGDDGSGRVLERAGLNATRACVLEPDPLLQDVGAGDRPLAVYEGCNTLCMGKCPLPPPPIPRCRPPPALLKTRFPPPPHANHIRSNAQKHATGGQT